MQRDYEEQSIDEEQRLWDWYEEIRMREDMQEQEYIPERTIEFPEAEDLDYEEVKNMKDIHENEEPKIDSTDNNTEEWYKKEKPLNAWNEEPIFDLSEEKQEMFLYKSSVMRELKALERDYENYLEKIGDEDGWYDVHRCIRGLRDVIHFLENEEGFSF